MLPPQQQIEEEVLEAAANLAESVSINRTVAQLYALLYIRPEPVSLEELAERLKISKGAASVNIRILEEWNAVKKIIVQGSRKDYYIAEEDFTKVILERIAKGLSKRFATLKAQIEKVQNSLSELKKENGTKPQILFYEQRIKKVREAQNKAEKILKEIPKLRSLLSHLF